MINQISKYIMRKLSRFIPVLFLLLSIFSCSGGLEEKIVGVWKGSDFLFVKSSGPDLVATINGGLDRHVATIFEINENGTYQKHVGDYDAGSGTWSLEDEALILIDDSRNIVNYKLLKLTDNELVTVHDVAMDTPEGEITGSLTLSYSR